MPTNFKNKIRSVSLDIINERYRVKNARTTKSCSQIRRQCLLLFIVYTVHTVTVLR